MQVCTSLQTDNHASTSPLCFYRPDALPAAQPTASKHWRHLPTKHKSLEITSRYSTGSQKLHHCCPLVNKVDNTWVQRSLGYPQSAPSCWGRSGPTHNTWFIQPQSAHPKCHLDNFIHFLRAHLTLMANRHTDRQACHATCVTIGHIPRYALRCGLKILS